MSAAVVERSRGGLSFGVIFFELFPAALCMAMFALVGIVHVTSRVMVVKVGYEMSKLDTEQVALTRENDRLKLELATLKSPSRLEGVARGKLGLSPPAAGSVIHLGVK